MRTAARIIETVEKLIKKYDTRDPYELCKCLGIKIHFYDTKIVNKLAPVTSVEVNGHLVRARMDKVAVEYVKKGYHLGI